MGVTDVVTRLWPGREATWAPHCADVAAHARERFDRLARTAEEPSFVAALG